MLRAVACCALLLAGVVAASAARAKEGPAEGWRVRICGRATCKTFAYRSYAGVFDALRSNREKAEPPPAPSPYLTVQYWFKDETIVRDTLPDAYLLPAGGLVREASPYDMTPGSRGWGWSQIRQPGLALLQRRTATLPRFHRPRVTRVWVGGTVAADPSSYSSLFAIALPVVHDAGYPPPFRRVLHEWLPIDIETRPPGPWSNSAAEFWLAKGRDLLLRNGRVLRVPPSLAQRIRRARSLTTFP